MVNIVKDIDPIELTKDYDVVMVGVSINNTFLDGFQRKIGLKYPYVYKQYKKLPYANRQRLGQNEYIEVYHKPIIALMHICAFPRKNYESIDYGGLEQCLMSINSKYPGMKCMTVIPGCSWFDGNADKEKVLQIINDTCYDLDVTVYDYQQKHWRQEVAETLREWDALKDTEPDKYAEIWENRKKLLRAKHISR